jgi:hypothetical protein
MSSRLIPSVDKGLSLNRNILVGKSRRTNFIISLFLKLTVHSTYTEKLQINEQIKLYTIYTNTVNRQMELAGRTNYHIYISNKFT